MTRYSIEPKDRIFVNGYRFLSFGKNMSKNIDKNVNGKYNQKRLDHAKQSATNTRKKYFKKVIQKIT